ncbi:MAG: hypothetical protein K0Q72_2608 [Armatimonadetes bacterium]|jgi:hypothetical protein|nr:hypothetical protein [Armatimonadota bacterium]
MLTHSSFAPSAFTLARGVEDRMGNPMQQLGELLAPLGEAPMKVQSAVV